MLEVILDEIKRIAKSRLFPIVILFAFLFIVLVHRIFTLQVVNGEQYQKNAESDNKKTIELKATRGNIYDRNGVLLAYNALSYSVQIDDNGELKTAEEKNEMLYKLIHFIEDQKGTISYDFPMDYDKKGHIQFTVEGNSLLKFKVNAYSRKNIYDLKKEHKDADAKKVYQYLIDYFEIGQQYSKEDTLKIMSIRYILFINRYNKKRDDYIPITLSRNLSERIVATLKENRAILPGVEVVEETNRVYKDSQYYASILGYTGTISSEALQEKQEEGDKYYSQTDQIGKSGLEAKFEKRLRGKKGYQVVVKNSAGNTTDIVESKEPVAGNDLYLTLDANLQKASYIMLEKELAAILLERIWNSPSYGSKGKSSDNIMIPINDVYFALIDNNLIDINHFTADNASELEKNVYSKYLNQQKAVMRTLKAELSYSHNINVSGLSNSMKSYMDQIYTSLKEDGVLVKSSFDLNDEVYKKYANEKTGLNSFLIRALEKTWINLEALDVGDKYFSTEELYNKLLDYTLSLLQNDKAFSKLIYYNMIKDSQLSGRDVCLLLFDQGVLKKDEQSIRNLMNGTLSGYTFMRNKIKTLEITPGQLALKPCSGSVVITDPNTGDTLACVTYPSYDNNRLANTVDSAYYAKLQADKAFPFVNRVTKNRIAPGSTFKTFSSLLALKEGIISTGSRITDRVVFTNVKPSPKCWSTYSHGSINVSEAIGVSCNYFFYQCGYNLSKDSRGNFISNIGLKKMQQYAKEVGLDSKSGLELAEDAPIISRTDAVRSMIGQGDNSFAPAQLSKWVTTIANEGTVYDLTLVDKITSPKGKIIKNYKAKIVKKLNVSNSYWGAIKLGMNKVVNASTSSVKKQFKDVGETVAGKTGTSQITTLVPNNALFISFAPYEKPKITTTVVIPNGYTSANAAQTASKIYEYYFEKDKKKQANMLKAEVGKTTGNTHARTD